VVTRLQDEVPVEYTGDVRADLIRYLGQIVSGLHRARAAGRLHAYPEWNPFVTSATVTFPDGRLRKGARLRNILHDRTGDTVFTPRVLTMDRDRELRWLDGGWRADPPTRAIRAG
jgi:hypothetical protein